MQNSAQTSQFSTRYSTLLIASQLWIAGNRERQSPFVAGTALAFKDVMDKLTYAVEPGLLFGRPGPNKSRWNLDALKLRGLAVVVSLVHIEDPKVVARAGLKHYVIPFEDRLYLPYKTANGFVLEIFDEFDRVLDLHLPKYEPVLVHCNSGKDRTGLLLAYYLVSRKGLSAKRALKVLRKLKPDALSGSGYEDILFALEPEMIRRREIRG